MIDLHTHSTFSDGKLTPTQLVAWAQERGVNLLSLTDHDSTDGISEAQKECEKNGMQFISGIEFSTFAEYEIHVLGYNIDYLNPRFVQELRNVKDRRKERNALLKTKLHSLGIAIDLDTTADGVGRMNFARALVAQGFCDNTNSAFDKYLGAHGAAYTVAERLKPIEAVQLIRKFGGVAVLAHPKRYLQEKRLDMLLSGLCDYGLQGIEVYYPAHNETDRAQLKKQAKKYNLILTGGSDYHGDAVYCYPEFELDEFSKRVLKVE